MQGGSQLARITFSEGYLKQEHLQQILEVSSVRTLRMMDVDLYGELDMLKALECRREPICVVAVKIRTYSRQDCNGIYIKNKDGHVQHYPK